MEELSAIAHELDVLERIQDELAEISLRKDDRRRHDLVLLRRRLSVQVTEVARVAEPAFNWLADAETARTHRSKLSRMRSATATHQADWPAVRLGECEAEYRASALTVREANKEFVSWARGTLTRLRR